jgi:methylthioribulose-1-phosphate dehydratase
MTSDPSERTPLSCYHDSPTADSPVDMARLELQEVGALLYEWGWSFGTSGNYSVVLQRDPLRLLITASGKDKSQLDDEDFVIVDDQGQSVEKAPGRPSAETMLHVALARRLGIGAVLHTHSIWCTLLTDDATSGEGLTISGFEMLKGLAGVTTHEHREWVRIFDNTQDIPNLAGRVQEYLDNDPAGRHVHGFLIRRHGLYTWGRDLAEARRHVEIFEFLFEILGRKR